MRIVKHPDTYICDKTGYEFAHRSLAVYCENYNQPPPNLKNGDSVLVKSRYDGYVQTTVKDIMLDVSGGIIALDRYNTTHGDIYVNLKTGEQQTLVEIIERKGGEVFYYTIITEDFVEVGEDCYFDNKWSSGEVVYCGSGTEWVNDYNNIPEESIVKYQHAAGNVIIEDYYIVKSKLTPDNFIGYLVQNK